MGVIAKQSIRGTFVTYLGVAIGAFTTFVVLTHFLTEEEIGLTRVLVEAATMLSGLAQLGTSASILRFYPYFKDEEHHDHGFFFWTLLVPLVGFLIFCLPSKATSSKTPSCSTTIITSCCPWRFAWCT